MAGEEARDEPHMRLRGGGGGGGGVGTRLCMQTARQAAASWETPSPRQLITLCCLWTMSMEGAESEACQGRTPRGGGGGGGSRTRLCIFWDGLDSQASSGLVGDALPHATHPHCAPRGAMDMARYGRRMSWPVPCSAAGMCAGGAISLQGSIGVFTVRI